MRSHTAMVLALCTAAATASDLQAQQQTTASVEARASDIRLYMRAVGREHRVAGRELEVLEAWVHHPTELPVLLFLADRAGVPADVIGSLRHSGQSWQRIALRFDLGPATFRVPVGSGEASGVLARPLREFARPAGQWHQIAMTDHEIVALVNLRLLSHQLGTTPEVLLSEVRDHAPDFIEAYGRLTRNRSAAAPPPA